MTTKVPNSIAKKRKDRGLSQAALSDMLGITVTQLSRLENGRSSMTPARMKQIADILEVNPQELYLAPYQTGELNLDIMHAVIQKLEEFIAKSNLSLSPKKRADLCIAIYRKEKKRLEEKGLTIEEVDISEYEDFL